MLCLIILEDTRLEITGLLSEMKTPCVKQQVCVLSIMTLYLFVNVQTHTLLG